MRISQADGEDEDVQMRSLLGLLTSCLRTFLWGYGKDQVHRQRLTMLDELTAWITAEIANVIKAVLQSIWLEVDYA
jgi:uncharacterized membrane protein YccF (DUF307 family)